MKQLSIALNILMLVLVAILFYLHFNSAKKPLASKTVNSSGTAVTPSAGGDKIVYFDMDSLQEHYNYFKDAESEVKTKEQAMKAELGSMERDYQKKMMEWQQKGPTMSQSEGEAAQREKARMEQRYQQRSEVLQESLGKQTMEIRKDIKLRIENFLKEYNKDGRYTYILASAPELIYYKDSTNDITADLVKGLNETYKKKGTSDK